MLRLRHRVGDRLPSAALSVVDDAIERVRELPAIPGESRADAALQLFTDRAERDHTRLRAGPRGRR
ncbi:hypothetical protein GCM10010435_60500 [Winogradskya consettensis]|uniref:Uncharacterized protein n=1 Tax=Winogradskya consettensis TaxID=113560 RepID=A0A919SR35_9ACTN|nr:hypothetical protein [Actinoplanes consettensis]GIM76364.1 hypothetical protein Aco04nite_50060 [Actinoplanes consettensis]